MDTISFKRHRFPPEIIRRAVWLYARFTLSYRDVEDLLAERGLDISLRERTALVPQVWCADCPKPAPHATHSQRLWPLDERVIVIRGQRYWLWRAVDNEGEVWISSCNRSGTPKPR